MYKIKSESQRHAAGTELPYNLNDNLVSNQREWAALDETWIDPGEPITYRINSHGYRAVEFNTVDWKNSVICIGDSAMFGTGVAQCHTIPYQLEKLIGLHCINLGECNASNLLMAENSIRLRQIGIKPKAVVVLLTTLYRTTWTTERKRVNMNPWTSGSNDELDYFAQWCMDEGRVRHQSVQALATIQLAWEHVPLAVLCYTDDTATACDAESIDWTSPDWIVTDRARDGRHSGPNTNSNFAKIFATMLEGKII